MYSLGAKAHTEYNLKTLSNCPGNIVAVALGQDHSLALTSSGEVLSWGLNRFSQLGYVVESLSGVPLAKSEEQIQLTPRRIYGPLKKEIVKGIAACKTASVCWTISDVFTWGTNDGQLGQ
jgi:inhibitor of Bruton tyrosine kinase